MTGTAKNTKPKRKANEYVYAVGRRRTSSARVRLFKGKGQTEVNGVPVGKYFPGEILKAKWNRPFEVVDVVGKYYATVKVVGGGRIGQLEAVVHGISRALAKAAKGKYRPLVKKAGLLTRDSRIRQRRMVGTGGKARRQKQSPKR